MRKFYILNIILFIFTLPKYLKVHSQEGSKEPLAKLWNIDNEDIPKYLNTEKELTKVDTSIRLFLDEDNFGGTYIDVIKNKTFINTINFAAAERLKRDPRISKYLNFLDFIAATNSTARLNYKFEEITKSAKSFQLGTCVGYIDARINDIVLGICNQTSYEENNVNFMNAIKIYNPKIFYYDCNDSTDDNFPNSYNMELGRRNNNIDINIMAGDGLYKIGTRNSTCTAGFVAITEENITCIATAGHCYLNDAKYYLQPWNSEPTTYLIGQMNFASLDKIDFGLIPIVGDVRPEPSIRNTDSETNRELFINDDITVSHYGVHLCVSGYYSHVKCGYVRSLSGFASKDKNFYENLFIVGLDLLVGDSGSPLFSYKQDLTRVSLNGILHGRVRNKAIQGEIAIVITISSILNTLRKIGREISVVTAK